MDNIVCSVCDWVSLCVFAGINAGIEIDAFAPRLSFFWGVGMNFYMVSTPTEHRHANVTRELSMESNLGHRCSTRSNRLVTSGPTTRNHASNIHRRMWRTLALHTEVMECSSCHHLFVICWVLILLPTRITASIAALILSPTLFLHSWEWNGLTNLAPMIEW